MSRAGMIGNEAGLVRMGNSGPKVILSTSAASADSGTGPTCAEAKFWTKWTFSLTGTFTGYSVQIYGTLDGTSWFLLPARSDQSGTGIEANPLTSISQSLSYDRPLKGVRAIASGVGQTGTVNVNVSAVP
jgi:hypothetical protein